MPEWVSKPEFKLDSGLGRLAGEPDLLFEFESGPDEGDATVEECV